MGDPGPVDDSGNARAVRWETLANLVPTEHRRHRRRTPPASAAPTRSRRQVADATVDRAPQGARRDWFAQARQRPEEPARCSSPRTSTDRDTRLATAPRSSRRSTATRLAELERLIEVSRHRPRTRRPHLGSTAPPTPPASRRDDSETDRRCSTCGNSSPTTAGTVDDVHTEGRGYDLDAPATATIAPRRGQGRLGSAASNGIRMTGNEVLIATQHRSDYWLYVVDHCADGTGRFFGAYADPATTVRHRHDRRRDLQRPRHQPQERHRESNAMTRMIERWFPCAEVIGEQRPRLGIRQHRDRACSPGSPHARPPKPRPPSSARLLPWPDDASRAETTPGPRPEGDDRPLRRLGRTPRRDRSQPTPTAPASSTRSPGAA